MTSMLSSVSSWWGASKPEDKPAESKEKPEETSPTEEKAQEPSGSDAPKQELEEKSSETKETEAVKEEGEDKQNVDIDIDEMSEKAINTAKEWGSYLYSFGKTATKSVMKTAQQMKSTVEEKTIIGDFNRENEKFVTENKEKKAKAEAAVPPWVGYNEEEAMKSQIMALSQDKRNFLRNPPAGVQFNFDFETNSPIAMATLQEDPNLQKMRFELVPKQINEENFWRNYFYRVSLIKQSAQLTSLAQQTGSTGETKTSRPGSAKSENSTPPDSEEPKKAEKEIEDLPPGSPVDNEFISDTFQDSTDAIDEEDLKREMQQFGLGDKQKAGEEDDVPEWEKELQAELQEYEVVEDDGVDDTDLEKEILQQLEEEAAKS